MKNTITTKTKTLVLGIALALGASITFTQAAPSGTAITNWNELRAVDNDLAGSYYLANSLDTNSVGYAAHVGSAGAGWAPIGTAAAAFTGTFDGNGKSIGGLRIDRPGEDYVGLFGCLDGGEVKELTIASGSIVGRNHVGAVVGYNNYGQIVNCENRANVRGHVVTNQSELPAKLETFMTRLSSMTVESGEGLHFTNDPDRLQKNPDGTPYVRGQYNFRGANPENWVQFGQVSATDPTPILWRVLSLSNDGIRLIYEGTKTADNRPPVEDGALRSFPGWKDYPQYFNEDTQQWVNATGVQWNKRPATPPDPLPNGWVWSSIIPTLWEDSDLYKTLQDWILSGIHVSSESLKPVHWPIASVRNMGPSTLQSFLADERVDSMSHSATAIPGLTSEEVAIGLITPSQFIMASLIEGVPVGQVEPNVSFGRDNFLARLGHLGGFTVRTGNLFNGNLQSAWHIGAHNGNITSTRLDNIGNSMYIRPIINISEDVLYVSGWGTLEHPFVIADPMQTGAYGVGGIAGFNSGLVQGCSNVGSIVGGFPVGGLVGLNKGTVLDGHNSGSVTSEFVFEGDASQAFELIGVGGIVGANLPPGVVENSENEGAVTGDIRVGGIVGGNVGSGGGVKDNENRGTLNGRKGSIAEETGENIFVVSGMLVKGDKVYVMTEAALRAALADPSVSKIHLANNITLTRQLEIQWENKTVEIDGQGHSLVIALGTTWQRHFYLNGTERNEANPGAWTGVPAWEIHLTLSNLVLEGYGAKEELSFIENGGISASYATLTLNNVEIFHCNAGGNGEGGAIMLWLGTLTMKDCYIHDNTARKGGAWTSGGAIALTGGGTAYITGNTRIENNQAQRGGGIYLFMGTLTIGKDVVIANNTAHGDGGGIYAATAWNTKVTIGMYGTIRDNTAGGSGGGIYAKGSLGQDDQTGAPFDVPVTIAIGESGSIAKNSAIVKGGGIYAFGADISNRNKVVGNQAAEGAEIYDVVALLNAAIAADDMDAFAAVLVANDYWDSNKFDDLNALDKAFVWRGVKGGGDFSADGLFVRLAQVTTQAAEQAASPSLGIASWTELAKIGQDAAYPLNGNYLLVNDLTTAMADYNTVEGGFHATEGWVSIGTLAAPFTGSFNGGGFEINGLWLERNALYQGLFGQAVNAKIRNIGLKLAEKGISGSSQFAGIVGYTKDTTITNCFVIGTLKTIAPDGRNRIGGIAGYAQMGTVIRNCHTDVAITGGGELGGIVGSLESGEIIDCYATGDITVSIANTGGVAGRAHLSVLTNCYATGNVFGIPVVSQCGGLIGAAQGVTLTNCFSSGNVVGGGYMGGLVGRMIVVGSVNTITNCYTTSDVIEIGTYGRTGGFVGDIIAGVTAMFVNCYAAGLVEANQPFGAFVGELLNGATVAFTNCYYDQLGTGMGSAAVNGAAVAGITGMNTDAMVTSAFVAVLNGYGSAYVGRKTEGDYDFYPELAVFANNANPIIVEHSKGSGGVVVATVISEAFKRKLKAIADERNGQNRKDVLDRLKEDLKEFLDEYSDSFKDLSDEEKDTIIDILTGDGSGDGADLKSIDDWIKKRLEKIEKDRRIEQGIKDKLKEIENEKKGQNRPDVLARLKNDLKKRLEERDENFKNLTDAEKDAIIDDLINDFEDGGVNLDDPDDLRKWLDNRLRADALKRKLKAIENEKKGGNRPDVLDTLKDDLKKLLDEHDENFKNLSDEEKDAIIDDLLKDLDDGKVNLDDLDDLLSWLDKRLLVDNLKRRFKAIADEKNGANRPGVIDNLKNDLKKLLEDNYERFRNLPDEEKDALIEQLLQDIVDGKVDPDNAESLSDWLDKHLGKTDQERRANTKSVRRTLRAIENERKGGNNKDKLDTLKDDLKKLLEDNSDDFKNLTDEEKDAIIDDLLRDLEDGGVNLDNLDDLRKWLDTRLRADALKRKFKAFINEKNGENRQDILDDLKDDLKKLLDAHDENFRNLTDEEKDAIIDDLLKDIEDGNVNLDDLDDLLTWLDKRLLSDALKRRLKAIADEKKGANDPNVIDDLRNDLRKLLEKNYERFRNLSDTEKDAIIDQLLQDIADGKVDPENLDSLSDWLDKHLGKTDQERQTNTKRINRTLRAIEREKKGENRPDVLDTLRDDLKKLLDEHDEDFKNLTDEEKDALIDELLKDVDDGKADLDNLDDLRKWLDERLRTDSFRRKLKAFINEKSGENRPDVLDTLKDDLKKFLEDNIDNFKDLTDEEKNAIIDELLKDIADGKVNPDSLDDLTDWLKKLQDKDVFKRLATARQIKDKLKAIDNEKKGQNRPDVLDKLRDELKKLLEENSEDFKNLTDDQKNAIIDELLKDIADGNVDLDTLDNLDSLLDWFNKHLDNLAPLRAIPRVGIYSTRISARTSAIREMNVRVYNRATNRHENTKVHYRAPVSKTYTILVAYSGHGDGVNYTTVAHGRMWSNDTEKAITFGGELLRFLGQTVDGHPSPINNRGQHIPVQYYLFNSADTTVPTLSFKGLATLDLKNARRMSVITGVTISETMPPPARLRNNLKVEQGVVDTRREPGQEADPLVLWEIAEGFDKIPGIHYPQAAFDEDSGELAPAHFFGTFTSRFDTSLTRRAGDSWPAMVQEVENRVPVLKR